MWKGSSNFHAMLRLLAKLSCRHETYNSLSTLYKLNKAYCVRGDGLEPVVVKIEENHLWFKSFQDQITELLNLNNQTIFEQS